LSVKEEIYYKTLLYKSDLFALLVYGLGRTFADTDWFFERCREVQAEPNGCLDLWAREHGKAQSLDEPTPTPTGWVRHGDLKEGDSIFSPDGTVCRVVALSPIYHGTDCYRITFDDGTAIKCSGNHLWEVERRTRKRISGTKNGRKYRESVVVNTREISTHNHGADNRLAVRVNAPLQLPDVALPVSPYLLGAWVGDGDSNGPQITSGLNDADEMGGLLRAEGIAVTRKERKHCVRLRLGDGIQGKRTSSDFMNAIRALGLAKNKHIPSVYLRASEAQRLALLQGLMDTDGTCNTRGTASFCTVLEPLAYQFIELCDTLGLKPSLYINRTPYNGKPHVSYHVSFQGYKSLPPFRLSRKLERCKDGERRNPRRYIVACEPVLSEPMRCIQVDREDGLYLTGRSMVTTHNSLVITVALTIFDIINNPEITIGIFSHTKPMAKSFLRVIKREFETNVELRGCFHDILFYNVEDSPKWSEDQGITVIRKGNPPEATVEAHGLVDGAPTGRHFDIRIYDDVTTMESVSTAEQMQKTLDALDMSHNLGKRGGHMRMIGTRYKVGDAYQVYIERGVVKPRIYPATDDGTAEGNPVYFSQDEWEKKVQEMSPAILSSQMLQNPMASDSVIFQPDWFRLWPHDKELPAFDAVFLSIDGAFSVKQTADDSCLMMLGLFKAVEGSSKYSIMVLDCYMEKVAYPELRDTVIDQYTNKYGANDKLVDACIVEDKASGSALIPDLKRAGIAVYGFNPGSLDKSARANLVSHLVRDGYLWLPESRNPKRKGMVMSWLSKAYGQLTSFPNCAHDDGVDAIVMALMYLDKTGYLRGKIVPERTPSYYYNTDVGSYS
jgi:predicted phage terminase large subunit-like protein